VNTRLTIANAFAVAAGFVRRGAGAVRGMKMSGDGSRARYLGERSPSTRPFPQGEGEKLDRACFQNNQRHQSSRFYSPGSRERSALSPGVRADSFPFPQVPRSAFSLVEILVVVTLLSVIVLALMAVFSSTQRAFRATVTQTDVLAGGRNAVDLIASDLRGLAPSGGVSNGVVNFAVFNNSYSPLNNSFSRPFMPLAQTLAGSSQTRSNLLNYFFILGRENTKWTGTGYAVDGTNTSHLYPLYRFYAETNVAYSPLWLYDDFVREVNNGNWTNMSHILDGVVQLTVHAYDTNGNWISNAGWPYYYTNAANTYFLAPAYGEPQFFMFSNTVPAAVQLEIGVLEDRALARAQSLSIPNTYPWNAPAQWQYLQNQAGTVHLFRQRVPIPNVDPSAYQ
jgi:type II secretory pathway pseudopilin PulG